MGDYKTEVERNAYSKGVFAHINGLQRTDNPYLEVGPIILAECWLAGFEEKGSIGDKTK